MYLVLKRLFDCIISFVLLILSLPLWPLLAISIKLDSPGEVFYIQDRVGKDGRLFRLIKFRSMIQGAENGIALWSNYNDERITRVGKFMRRFHLDEMPQLFNILVGQMSLVGPRPERPEFAEVFNDKIEDYKKRLSVTPGISGWAQIHIGYAGEDIDDHRKKLLFDLEYIQRKSFLFDLKIMLKTFGAILGLNKKKYGMRL